MPLIDVSDDALVNKVEELRARNTSTLNKDEALELAIEASQLALQFMSIAQNPQQKKQTKSTAEYMVEQAERIKSSSTWNEGTDGDLIDLEPLNPVQATPDPPRTQEKVVDRAPERHLPSPDEQSSHQKLSTAEKLVLLRGSKIDDCKYPLWENEPGDDEFELKAGTALFSDQYDFRLSPSQEATFDGWKRPSEALPASTLNKENQDPESRVVPRPCMTSDASIDLVQDAATDCSIVASLAAGIARAEKGHGNVFTENLFPQDKRTATPLLSDNGKYVVRLNFNGHPRRVIIDDRLPVSSTERLLHVINRQNRSLLWPALLEKAYLKVRGGYDFPGSNSTTDLWIMTGWIPEQIFLQHEETDLGQVWRSMVESFAKGDVLVTLGTGEMTEKSELETGLASTHDYAVLSYRELNNQKALQIKNPWFISPTLNSSRNAHEATLEMDAESSDGNEEFGDAVSHIQEDASTRKSGSGSKKSAQLAPGTFWMSFDLVVQNFDSMYLNWKPSIYPFRRNLHFDWDLSEGPDVSRSPAGSFFSNPQHTVQSTTGGAVLILLSRHFKSRFNNRENLSIADSEQYMSLYAFSKGGKRVYASKGSTQQTHYLDSPQTLLRLDLLPRTPYTIVTAEQGLISAPQTFTMSIMSYSELSLTPAVSRYTDHVATRGSWTRDTSGGGVEFITYGKNPQYGLHLPASSRVALMLETWTTDISIHVKLVHAGGLRVSKLAAKDVIVDSASYRRNYAFAETAGTLPAGNYTIICSTYDAAYRGEFKLYVESNVNAAINVAGREGAGRLSIRLADVSFGAGDRKVGAPLTPRRLARIHFTATVNVRNSSAGDERDKTPKASPMRLTVERGRGPNRAINVASGAGSFANPTRGIKTDDVDFTPPRKGRGEDTWLMLERMRGFDGSTHAEERVSVEYFADTAEPALDVGVWRNMDDY
ncbi:MAG: cysteine protease [Chrysothrix sp. TS-e1954]|nr:MAG: cysteine protease [Chrysothrix sp. TS-e1954]